MNRHKILYLKNQMNQVVAEHFKYLFSSIPTLESISMAHDTTVHPTTGEALFFGLNLVKLNEVSLAKPQSLTLPEAGPDMNTPEFRSMLVEMNLSAEEFILVEEVLLELGTNFLLHCREICRKDFLL